MNFYYIVLSIISFFILIATIRVIIGPTIWDRLLGLNMISTKITIAIVMLAVIMDKSLFLDIALVYAILGFIGTVLISRFIERNGDI